MSSELQAVLKRHSSPLVPQPTETVPQLKTLSGLKAALFDIYGTMLISASGEVGTVSELGRGQFFLDALLAAKAIEETHEQPLDGKHGMEVFFETIHQHHAASKAEGIPYPEVEIRDVWKDCLTQLKNGGWPIQESINFDLLAIQYELRINPTWPMPHLVECLERFQAKGIALGIVSNAQFFTPLLFPSLIDRTLEDFGFNTKLQFYSYQFKRAKPDTFLYEQAVEILKDFNIQPHEVLYVGNDLLNDITPASKVGFRTALFAGDARSLRWREGDERVQGVCPDLVVTNWPQLLDCLETTC
ncbi:Haloacid dehalogenase domain protein hydrolase [Planctomycetales bacterium 10988]|nr:Haloacid dehalogenase domain protein hydrolase [Planctomycetales bacterium 10988]